MMGTWNWLMPHTSMLMFSLTPSSPHLKPSSNDFYLQHHRFISFLFLFPSFCSRNQSKSGFLCCARVLRCVVWCCVMLMMLWFSHLLDFRSRFESTKRKMKMKMHLWWFNPPLHLFTPPPSHSFFCCVGSLLTSQLSRKTPNMVSPKYVVSALVIHINVILIMIANIWFSHHASFEYDTSPTFTGIYASSWGDEPRCWWGEGRECPSGVSPCMRQLIYTPCTSIADIMLVHCLIPFFCHCFFVLSSPPSLEPLLLEISWRAPWVQREW